MTGWRYHAGRERQPCVTCALLLQQNALTTRNASTVKGCREKPEPTTSVSVKPLQAANPSPEPRADAVAHEAAGSAFAKLCFRRSSVPTSLAEPSQAELHPVTKTERQSCTTITQKDGTSIDPYPIRVYSLRLFVATMKHDLACPSTSQQPVEVESELACAFRELCTPALPQPSMDSGARASAERLIAPNCLHEPQVRR